MTNTNVDDVAICCRREYRNQSTTELLAQPIAVMMVPTSVSSSNVTKDVVAEKHFGQVLSWATVDGSMDAEEKANWVFSITVDDCFFPSAADGGELLADTTTSGPAKASA